MSVEEVRMLKEKLEESIRDEVTSFQRQTGLRVQDICLTRWDGEGPGAKIGLCSEYIVQVRVEV